MAYSVALLFLFGLVLALRVGGRCRLLGLTVSFRLGDFTRNSLGAATTDTLLHLPLGPLLLLLLGGVGEIDDDRTALQLLTV